MQAVLCGYRLHYGFLFGGTRLLSLWRLQLPASELLREGARRKLRHASARRKLRHASARRERRSLARAHHGAESSRAFRRQGWHARRQAVGNARLHLPRPERGLVAYRAEHSPRRGPVSNLSLKPNPSIERTAQ